MVMGENNRKNYYARAWVALFLLMVGYVVFIRVFADYMQNKPFVEKVGYVPTSQILKVASVDHQELVGEILVLRVLLYFGGLMEKNAAKLEIPPDYPAMSRMLHLSTKLDPYNMDAYYFAQSILAWDVRQVELANNFLEYGMKYRTWDWSLPYYVGFNSAYFLKDYEKAAEYYMLAGKLSGSSLFNNLAGRYLYEAGQTELALAYLSAMVKSAKNPDIQKIYQTRLDAMQAIRWIEMARDSYRRDFGNNPSSIETLYGLGYLPEYLKDPYGGVFYLEPDGKVNVTSHFAFH